MKKVKVLGIPLNAVSESEAIEKIAEFIDSGKPHQITTVNAEFILEAQNNKEFCQTLEDADLSVADSTGVTWAARFKGHPLPERIPGADLVDELARIGADKGWKFYLLGAGPGIAKAAANNLRARYPKLTIVGFEEGFTTESDWLNQTSDDREVSNLIKKIQDSQPDILLVAFGAPKQDLFISRYKKELDVPVMIGVGGTFDFLAGRIKRAPQIMRSFGLEWFWRLIQEPRRWPRIFRATIVFPLKVILGDKR